MTSEYLAKYHALSRLIQGLKSVVVAYSGGVDSTLLAFLCHKILGEKALAVTADSQIHPAFELSEAVQLAREFGFPHYIIKTPELTNPDFFSNPPNRCYYCKQELFKKLREIADKNNITKMLEGTTLSDAGDYRPGRQAAIELGVRSPLLEAGLSKEEVRLISKELGLPTWEKLSYTCLATRFPYGTRITAEKLVQVAQAEDFLRGLGFKVIRVRHHQDIARIEVSPEEILQLLEPETKDRIIKRFRTLGYVYITVDLEGYRSGSMNKEITNGEVWSRPQAKAVATVGTDVVDVESPPYMACPRCENQQLEEIVTEEARLKQCSLCGGIWFELNELEKALGENVKFVLPEGMQAKECTTYPLSPVCPDCQTYLIRIKALEMHDLAVEACIVCQGRWVDGSEIARLQNRGFFARIKKFVMGLF